MKKRFFISMLLILSLVILSSCGKKEEASGEPTQADEIAGALDVLNNPDEGEVKQEESQEPESTPNHFIQNISELSDPWSGTVAVGELILDSTKTFADIQAIMPTTYQLAYINIEDKGDGTSMKTTAIGDPALIVPKSGTFEVAYSPVGITNASDARMLTFVFGVPYHAETNPNQRNAFKWSINDYKIQEVRFKTHRDDGSETGVGFTVPGFRGCVSTKYDMIDAFGNDTKTSEASNNVKFYKPNTVYKDVTGNFKEGDADSKLTDITLVYDVNYGVDTEHLGSNSGFGNFGTFIDGLSQGTYYGFYYDENGLPLYAFTANPDAVDQTNLVAYSVEVTGLVNNKYRSYHEVNSSQVDNMPVKVSPDGYIFVASPDQVIKILINTEDLCLQVDKMSSRLYDEEGNVSYETTVGGETTSSEESTDFDALMNEYNNASAISMALKD